MISEYSSHYYGHFIGKLSNREENIFGQLFAVDKNTVFIQNFTYLDDTRKYTIIYNLLKVYLLQFEIFRFSEILYKFCYLKSVPTFKIFPWSLMLYKFEHKK